MKENMLKGCGLLSISDRELQIRGGTAWQDFFKLARYVKMFMDFISEYKEDFYRGFKKGWRSI